MPPDTPGVAIDSHTPQRKRKRDLPHPRASGRDSGRPTPPAYARRTPPPDTRRQSKDLQTERTNTVDDGDESPPRKLKRPGAGSRITPSGREAAERAQKQREEAAIRAVSERQGSNVDAVAQHYNAVPQFGREWRQSSSKISGLRNLNNWIKSTLIQKFSRPETGATELRVLDMACGKGGDLGKWEKAPQPPVLYVGCDIASVSIEQARERYSAAQHKRRGHGRGSRMEAEFYVHDAFGRSLHELPAVRAVGFNPNAGATQGIIYPQGIAAGFDVVSIMFALHYSFETEQLARGMLKNVAGALKKGGKFFGVMPNSDVISSNMKRLLATAGVSLGVNGPYTRDISTSQKPPTSPTGVDDEEEWDPEKPSDAAQTAEKLEDDEEWDPEAPSEPQVDLSASAPAPGDQSVPPVLPVTPHTVSDPIQWGNSIYKIRFPHQQPLVGRPLPKDGVFRPPYGWRYHYSLEEAVDAPEYVVPWEAFRALAEDFGLELMYRKSFREVFEDESGDRELGMLAERMHVMSRDRSQGNRGLLVSDEEMEAASFYHAFCFYKI